jgi:ATPase subunit of ABC transporter with duplicated ATPase domains
VITVSDLEIRAGARVLIDGASFRIAPGDRIGLVGRNGAGKTTTTKVLAGLTQPASGTVSITGEVGYLPQDPKVGDLSELARDRILSARGLDTVLRDMDKLTVAMAELLGADRDRAVRDYGRLEETFVRLGGWAAQAEAEAISSSLGLPLRILDQQLGTLSGGQRRRLELARILFAGAQTLLLDEPTNHLDADSIVWLRDHLRRHSGGMVVISHDVGLLEHVCTRVFHLDATRAEIDIYNVGWRTYLQQRETDEKRRKRERANAEKQIAAFSSQANRMRASATRANQAKELDRRVRVLQAGMGDVRQADKVAKLRFPDPAPCGKTPLMAGDLSKSYGSLEIFTDVSLAVDKGARVVILGLNGAGKTTLLRILAGVEAADTGAVEPGHGLVLGYYAQEHETLDHDRTVMENLQRQAPGLTDVQARTILGSFLFSGDVINQITGTLSGGEKTRLALAGLVSSRANVLLLDEPTNNLDPASRAEVLKAIGGYAGAIVMVTHDEGAVRALEPQKVILLPDGDEDLWSEDYLDLVSLA